MAFLAQRQNTKAAASMGPALLLSLVLTPMSPIGAQAASFDCNAQGLQPDEKTICGSLPLNDADVKMVTTFDLLSGLLAMGSRGTLQDEQTAWLKKRQACGGDAECIRAAYDERLKQLDETYKHLNRPL